MQEDRANASSCVKEEGILKQFKDWELTSSQRQLVRDLIGAMDTETREQWLRHGTVGIRVLLARNGDNESLNQLLKLVRLQKWMRHRESTWFIKGAESQDLRLVMQNSLWTAVCDFNPGEQSFEGFAETCMKRACVSAIKTGNRKKHEPLNGSVSYETVMGNDDEDGNLDFTEVIAADPPVEDLTETTLRKCLADMLMGLRLSKLETNIIVLLALDLSYHEVGVRLSVPDKSVDNARCRIKRKIEKACSTDEELYESFGRLCNCIFTGPEEP